MADKSFEERVNEEMSGLSLKPGAEVWEGIEIAIQKEKRRRWFIWLFILLGGCGSGSFLFYHGFIENNKNKSNESFVGKSKHNNSFVNPELNSNKSIIIDSNLTQTHQISTGNTGAIKYTAGKILYESISQKNRPSKQQTAANLFTDEKKKISQSMHLSSEELSNEAGKAAIQTNQTLVKDNPEKLSNTIDQSLTANIDQKSENTDSVKADTSSVKTSTVQAEIRLLPQIKSKYHWQFAASVDIDKSGVSELSDQNTGGLFNSAVQPATGGTGFVNTNKTPSLSGGLSWGINLEAFRKVNEFLGFRISLGYQLFQSQIGIGNRIDSTVIMSSTIRNIDDGFYYLNTDQKKYTNQYHFLQTSVSFYTDHLIAKAVSIRWHLGTVANLLISSNVVQYDAAKGILYRSRNSLNGFQFSLSTGFDIGLGKKPDFYAGPALTYFITHPSRMQGSDNQHLFRMGARIVYVLPKKKK